MEMCISQRSANTLPAAVQDLSSSEACFENSVLNLKYMLILLHLFLCLLILRRTVTAPPHSHSDWKTSKDALCKLHSPHNCFEKIKPKDFVSALF